MGAKTALLAFADGDIRDALRGAARSDRAAAEEHVRRIHPGYAVEPAADSTLLDCSYPPDDITYATALPGADLCCDNRLVLDRPSELSDHLRQAGAGRRIIMHGMHSVVDWLCFAVWEDGVLVRSLSLSPNDGLAENIGKPSTRSSGGAGARRGSGRRRPTRSTRSPRRRSRAPPDARCRPPGTGRPRSASARRWACRRRPPPST